MRKTLLRLVTALALLAATLGPRPLRVARAEARLAPELTPGALTSVRLSAEDLAFTVTGPSNSVYDVWLFPAEEALAAAHAELWQGETLLAEGDGGMPALSLRLTAGVAYTLKLSGEGRARVELARHALSRCFDMPMPLDPAGDAYSKAIARQGDVHWYAVEPAEALPLALACVPDAPGLRLQAQLFDDDGRMLAEAVRTTGGACLVDFAPEAGRRYALRVFSPGGTGAYSVQLARCESGQLPDLLTLSRDALTLNGRQSARLSARVSPGDAGGLVYWESSDPSVAVVDGAGLVSGVGGGAAVVTAYATGGVFARCRVEVLDVPVTSVNLVAERIALNVGDDTALECFVLPANATDPAVEYVAEPEGIVEIDAHGVLRAVAEGSATVTALAADGTLRDALDVSVGPAPVRRRALLVGEQSYASTVAAPRPGSANSVAAIRSMLGQLSFSGSRYRVQTRLDLSRDGVIAAIRETFGEAADADLSLFYITCHGYYADGMTCLQMYDGSVLTAAELAAELRRVPGRVLLILDCCGSGGIIGRGSASGDILRGVNDVFGGLTGPAEAGGSGLWVLASAALEQDSYRLSFSENATEADMATVFARALCEAGGWSVDRSARAALRADADYDGAVTLDELYRFTSRRVMWYLELAGRLAGQPGSYVQSVQVLPEGEQTPVFARVAE